MLKELKEIRQWSGERARRVFMDSDFDLFVWNDEAGAVTRFQLGYDKAGKHRAFEWANGRLSHYRIDAGQDSAHTTLDRTPLLIPDATGSPEETGELLRRDGIEEPGRDILEFVLKQLGVENT